GGGAQALDVASPESGWNGLGDGLAHWLVVEAVDQLGPVPQANLYTGLETTPLAGGGMLGSNKGVTADGKVSTNGQGPYTNNPQVIAQSAPFVVQSDQSYRAIPSKATAMQQFFDTFENAEGSTIQQISRDDTISDAFGNL